MTTLFKLKKAQTGPFAHGLTTITPRNHTLNATPEQLDMIRQDCLAELERAQAILTAIIAVQFPSTDFLAPYALIGSVTPDTTKSLVAFVATARGSQQLHGMTSSIGTLYQRTIDNFLAKNTPSTTDQQAVVAIQALQALSSAKAAVHKLAERLTQFHNDQQFVRHLESLVENFVNTPLRQLQNAMHAFFENNNAQTVKTECEQIGHLLLSIDRELTDKLGERNPEQSTQVTIRSL